MPRTSNNIQLRSFETDDAPWLIARHGALYREADGFDDTFAPLVASIAADFLTHHDPARERGWIAWQGTRRIGSIFCVAGDAEGRAKLRLFLLEPDLRGHGLGARLLEQCLSFAEGAGYCEMTLWTHESHRAACALYAKTGFVLDASRPVHSFGQDLVEQSWSIALPRLAIGASGR